ncbi:MAG: hypothetical protein VZS44_04925 [Bacilli bacterium]|nr:hypothetical protein [Bacilli bacterium]
MNIVELGIKLDNNIDYYTSILEKNGLRCVFNVNTHDIYYTNKDLGNLTENEMKKACIRLRSCNNEDYKIQNNLIKGIDISTVSKERLKEYENKLLKYGYKKVFATIKEDYHYCKDDMNSRVQLQQIKDIGLVVYYDNNKYYNINLKEQRKKLIDDLNSFGFNIDYDTLDLDKLRTLYYGKEMYSNNQNK